MANKSNASVIGVSTILLTLPLAMSSLHGAEGGTGPKKQAVKGGGQKSEKAQAQQNTGGASISSAAVVSESGTASNLVRAGLSVDLVNQIDIADLKQFSKMVESQRATDGLDSVAASLKRCNASGEDGVSFIANVAKLVGSGQSIERLVDFSRSMGKGEMEVGDAGRFLGVVASMKSEDAELLMNRLGSALRSADTGDQKLVRTLVSTIAGDAAKGVASKDLLTKLEQVSTGKIDLASAGLTAAEKAAADKLAAEKKAAADKAAADKAAADKIAADKAAAEQAFRLGLTADARSVFDNLTTQEQAEFRKLFTGPLYEIELQKVSEFLQNAVLMEQFIAFMGSNSGKSMANPLLQEAAVVGNQILRDVVRNESFALSSAEAFTYDKMFPNGYNKALATLIARYSNNEAIANTVNTFVDSKLPITGATLLNQIFTESGENTDLLGLRKLSYIKATAGNLNYAISQGEAWMARNFTLGSSELGQLDVDLTHTNLWHAANTRAGARLFAVTALGNMSLNGIISFGLQNRSYISETGTPRDVISLGALNTVTIADNTQIYSPARILALGAGKFQGPNGAPISGLQLGSGGSIVIGSGKSLFLENASFSVGPDSDLLMYAQNTISLSNSWFHGSGERSNFYLEAITINLSNVDLPGDAFIRLVSRDGGTADGSTGYGYFPRFGAPAVGRVNFMGVSIGGYAINSTSDFDAFGGKIRIGKIGEDAAPIVRFWEGFFGDSSVAHNRELMEKFLALFSEASSLGFTNPMLQEAATVGNQLIRSTAFSGKPSYSYRMSERETFTYDKLFPNGYNKALVALIAKYSGSERLVNGINALITAKAPINDSSMLSSIFTEDGQNTDLLGLRKLSYFKPTAENLSYTLSQGETFFGKNISLIAPSANYPSNLDVTDTKLKEAGNTKQSARLYTVAALGDMQMTGKFGGRITVKNSNPDADKTRNVVAIGAVNALKVADRTEIINQGRILAVGAGKLQGTNGETITGLKLESKGAIAVGSGKNMNLVDATFTVGNSKSHLVMFAQDTMSVTNPTFNNFGSKSEIYMEATTVNLTNVDFPGGANVRLRSRDGGTQDGISGEGNYPKFGTSAAGRVNFISNVKYNGNLIGNTAQFDAHGGNISIRKAGPAN